LHARSMLFACMRTGMLHPCRHHTQQGSACSTQQPRPLTCTAWHASLVLVMRACCMHTLLLACIRLLACGTCMRMPVYIHAC
jgi:hypothetical protein